MSSELITTEAPDGRTLATAQWGDPEGTPVFSLHGTPGSRLRRPADDDAVHAAGLRVITYDRPGYGASDRHAGRRVVDCVADIAAIADELGLDRFFVAGGSGGAPHALAAAACLPDRVIAAEAAVCPAPWGTDGLDFFAGMDPENVREFGWALDGAQVLQPELARQAAEMLAHIDSGDGAALPDDFQLDAADLAVMARPDVQTVFQAMLREAFRTGVWGWVDDDLAILADWGFALADIEVPVTVRYGSKDVLVPAAHGEWVGAHVPNARVVVTTEGGHLVTPEQYLAELAELVRT